MDPSGWQLAVCGHTAWWLVASWCKPRMVPKTIHVVMWFFTLFYGVLVCFCPIIVIALRVSLLLVHCAHSWRVSSISILVLVMNGPRWVAFLPCRSQQFFFKRMQPMWFGSSMKFQGNHAAYLDLLCMAPCPSLWGRSLLGKCRLVICERLFLSYFYGEQGGVGRKRWQMDLCWQFLSIENCN